MMESTGSLLEEKPDRSPELEAFDAFSDTMTLYVNPTVVQGKFIAAGLVDGSIVGGGMSLFMPDHAKMEIMLKQVRGNIKINGVKSFGQLVRVFNGIRTYEKLAMQLHNKYLEMKQKEYHDNSKNTSSDDSKEVPKTTSKVSLTDVAKKLVDSNTANLPPSSPPPQAATNVTTGSLTATPGTGSLTTTSGTGSLTATPGTGSLTAASGTGSLTTTSGTGSLTETGSLTATPGTGSLIATPGTGSLTATTGTSHSVAPAPDLPILGQKPTMNLIQEVSRFIAADWRDIGYRLDFDADGNEIDVIAEECREHPKKCCVAMLKKWIQGKAGIKPVKWKTLLQIILSEDHQAAHDSIMAILQKKQQLLDQERLKEEQQQQQLQQQQLEQEQLRQQQHQPQENKLQQQEENKQLQTERPQENEQQQQQEEEDQLEPQPIEPPQQEQEQNLQKLPQRPHPQELDSMAVLPAEEATN